MVGNKPHIKKTSAERYFEEHTLDSLASGNEEAFCAIFREYYPRILRIALRHQSDRALAEDAAQEVFIKLWNRRKKLAHIEDFDKYLLSMAFNMVKDLVRDMLTKRKYENSYAISRPKHVSNTGENTILEGQYQEQLELHFKNLPEQQRKVFEAVKFQHRPIEDIASELGITINTAKKHMSRASNTLKSVFRLAVVSFIAFILG